MHITLVGPSYLHPESFDEWRVTYRNAIKEMEPLFEDVRQRVQVLIPDAHLRPKVSISVVSQQEWDWVEGTIATLNHPVPDEETIKALMSLPYVQHIVVVGEWDHQKNDYAFRRFYGEEKQVV